MFSMNNRLYHVSGVKKDAAKNQAKEILKLLHATGGCDTENGSWEDGWDAAITEAISIVEGVTGVSIEEVLD